MNYAIYASIAALIVGLLLLRWVCKKVDDTQPKNPAEWNKEG